MSIVIEPILCFDTNYAWLLFNEQENKAIIVDPGEASPIIQRLNDKNLILQAILITHFHSDHIDGVPTLKSKYECKVIGPKAEANKIKSLDIQVQDGDGIKLPNWNFPSIKVIHTPGHTLGSVCYYIPALQVMFTGDTLFSLGCGRVFEGTYAQMFNSLKKIAGYPDNTRLYCGHEYTVDNAKFAQTILKKNEKLQTRFVEAVQKTANSDPTLPTLLRDEKEINPFLVVQDVDQFALIRKAKDHFM